MDYITYEITLHLHANILFLAISVIVHIYHVISIFKCSLKNIYLFTIDLIFISINL